MQHPGAVAYYALLSIVAELAGFLAHRDVMGWVLAATLLFFSSLAFTVLENAMSIIFFHRVAVRRRRFLVSALIPYCSIMFLGAHRASAFTGRSIPSPGRRSISSAWRARSWS